MEQDANRFAVEPVPRLNAMCVHVSIEQGQRAFSVALEAQTSEVAQEGSAREGGARGARRGGGAREDGGGARRGGAGAARRRRAHRAGDIERGEGPPAPSALRAPREHVPPLRGVRAADRVTRPPEMLLRARLRSARPRAGPRELSQTQVRTWKTMLDAPLKREGGKEDRQKCHKCKTMLDARAGGATPRPRRRLPRGCAAAG